MIHHQQMMYKTQQISCQETEYQNTPGCLNNSVIACVYYLAVKCSQKKRKAVVITDYQCKCYQHERLLGAEIRLKRSLGSI